MRCLNPLPVTKRAVSTGDAQFRNRIVTLSFIMICDLQSSGSSRCSSVGI